MGYYTKYVSKKGGMKKIAKKQLLKPAVSNLAQRVKSLEQSREKKHIDVFGNIASVGSTATLTALDAVHIGSTDITRIGDTIKPLSLCVKGAINMNDSNTETDFVRVMLIMDKENRGATPAIADLLDSTGTIYTAFKNTNNDKRFKIIRDKLFCLTAGGLAATKFKWYIPFNKSKIMMKYVADNATEADFRENHFYLVYVSKDNTNKASLAYESRLWFTDS